MTKVKFPPRIILQAAADAIRARQLGDTDGPTADEILATYYGEEEYPLKALTTANEIAKREDRPELDDLPDEKPCLGCDEMCVRRPHEAPKAWFERKYHSIECARENGMGNV